MHEDNEFKVELPHGDRELGTLIWDLEEVGEESMV